MTDVCRAASKTQSVRHTGVTTAEPSPRENQISGEKCQETVGRLELRLLVPPNGGRHGANSGTICIIWADAGESQRVGGGAQEPLGGQGGGGTEPIVAISGIYDSSMDTVVEGQSFNV